jgi:formate dehydrogenase alpha subunit
MVSLMIDGRDVTVADNSTILDAAAQLGIRIPTLCFLRKVSPTGACRICVVEIEGVGRPMTACNTQVKEGIRVTTQSEQLTAIRLKMVRLLLVNHPLDCPVCDAGGECSLQDACYELGVARQEYTALLERRQIRYDWSLLESDPNRCILCEKCIKVDHEIVGADAIAVVNCGESAIIDTVNGGPLACEFCGNCIAACPTGTLISKPFKFRARPWALTVTRSICPFCPAGCQIEYHTRNGRVERVTSDDATFNSGNLCINGRFGYSYLNSPERLTMPLMREGNTQVAIDWQKAMQEAVARLKEVIKRYGPDAVAGISSPRLTNEENFLFRKLMRDAIGTGNIDSEARLGYAPTQAILMERLGLSGASATIDRIDDAATLLVIGCDLNAEATGIEYRVIRAATKNDATLVLANMRDVKLKKYANSYLKYSPGGEVSLLNGLMKAILDKGMEDREFIGANVNNLSALKKELENVDLDELALAAGVSASDLCEAARLIGGRKSVAIIFGADLMRSEDSQSTLDALVNLALLTGCLGKEAGGLFPIDEKNNTQGLFDMGITPGSIHGNREQTERGKDLWQIIEGIEQDSIKALFLAGSDILSFPNNNRIRKALPKLDFLLVQDIFPTESAGLAHILFPAAAAAEKSGTFTTSDNRVLSLGRVIDPPGDAREDWDILADLYSRLSFVRHAGTTAELLVEIRETIPRYANSNTRESKEGNCATAVKEQYQLSSTGYSFTTVTAPIRSVEGAEFRLLAGPILFHSGTTTTRSKNNLTVAPEGYIEIFTADAGRLEIDNGGLVSVSSAVGSITGKARVTSRLQPGLLFAPYHFRDLNVNSLLEGSANLVGVRVEKC